MDGQALLDPDVPLDVAIESWSLEGIMRQNQLDGRARYRAVYMDGFAEITRNDDSSII